MSPGAGKQTAVELDGAAQALERGRAGRPGPADPARAAPQAAGYSRPALALILVAAFMVVLDSSTDSSMKQ
jgi:hypothetical protein